MERRKEELELELHEKLKGLFKENPADVHCDMDRLKAHIAKIHKKHKLQKIDGRLYSESVNNIKPSEELLNNIQSEKVDLDFIISTFVPEKTRDDFRPFNNDFLLNLFDLLNTLYLNPNLNDHDINKVRTKLYDEENVEPAHNDVYDCILMIETGILHTKQTNNALAIFSHNSISIKTKLEALHENLLFLSDAVNLVIGESKSGKTYTTCKSLVDNGFKEQVIHIDFERNSDERLKELGIKTYHIDNAVSLVSELVSKKDKVKSELIGKILIIDSLQDLSQPDGLDTNKAALDTMNNVLAFRETGATLILIHHTTLEKGGLKVKGNSTTITSKCDTTISMTRKDTERTFKVVNTRAEDKIPSGRFLTYLGENPKKKKNEPPK